MNQEINEDGSMVGITFTEKFNGGKYTKGVPQPQDGDTYSDYRKRVDEAVKKGFHLGDMGNTNWTNYCMGSGSYEGVNSNNLIDL